VIQDLAERIGSARIQYNARVRTTVIDAAIVIWAFLIHGTSADYRFYLHRCNWVAGPTRVAGVTRRASTGGSMQSCSADGVDAAALNPACVDARSGVALLVDAAVIVNHALGPGFHFQAFSIVANRETFWADTCNRS